MDIIVPNLTGFCPGVKRAQTKLFALKKQTVKPIYILGHLIHNRNYIESLETQGIHTVQSVDEIPPDSHAVIRTHGIPKELETRLAEKIAILDCTCGKVKKIQNIIAEHSARGFFVIITGKKDHPEVRGLKSYASDGIVVESVSELQDQIDTLDQGKVLLISQTTADRKLFDDVRHFLAESLEQASVTVYDSICDITVRKEKEALNLQASADAAFVIGDEISSNAKRLYNTLKQAGKVYFIHSVDDLRIRQFPFKDWKKVMVVSSASTPDYIEAEVISFLQSL
ncbi:MAG: 4-hydroxy-3-methylbut-2-enyl diphosphate reductase [Spirochaetia bacterium]